MTPRDERASFRPRPRPRPRSRARHSARWTPRWISASFARRSTRIVARSPTRAEGGAHSCGPSPDVVVTLGARADGPRRTLARVDALALEQTLAKVVGPPPDTRAAGHARVPVVRIPERSWSC